MNIIFISPNFPTNYWQFCKELKNNGANVYGIGDCPYDNLDPNLKACLDEYYKVGTLESYDEVYRAVAFLTFKHGRIDFIESNNEYWLEQDARLRTDFNITSGFQTKDMPRIKYKSEMKKYYKKIGLPVARYHMISTERAAKTFIKKVNYPVVAKPDNGVGASDTWKITCDADLDEFFAKKMDNVQYIMEEFINAEVNSYDAIIDSNGEPIFENSNVTPDSIMDIVNNNDNSLFFMRKELPEDIKEVGRATVKAFGVTKRFVHFEFFRLNQDQEPHGKKGDLMGLEVNMRPSGGVSPDMMNFAHSTNVYKIWADMVCNDKTEIPTGQNYYCGFAGLRDGKPFAMSPEDIQAKYAANIKVAGRVDEALSAAMGNQLYMATFDTLEELQNFYKDVTTLKED